MGKKITRICIPIVIFIFGFTTGNALAANYITVATIGSAPSLDQSQEPQKLVNQVIAFWERELSQALTDKPDLILLPEYCDLSSAGEEYIRVRN